MSDKKGKLIVVGFGPGDKRNMTLRAVEAIEEADVVTGYTTYVDIIQEHFPDKEYKATGMMKEMERCRMAISDALRGLTVALISSGDSGIYGMAGIVLEIAEGMDADLEIEMVPGITAASMASAILGAPLMHDFAVVSLSDLMTPLDLIMKRVEAAAEVDFVICLYNPRSKKRVRHLTDAVAKIGRHRPMSTPVGVVRNAGREGQSSTISTLSELESIEIDMFTVLIVGNSCTYVSNQRMITPRGYRV